MPELAALKTREPGDPSMALLDAWATVGDVLTFYQERIANEGYLRTAIERRSVLELARLIGYALRPGRGGERVSWPIRSTRTRRRSRSPRARGPTAFPRRASRCRRSRPPIRSSRATNGTAQAAPHPAADCPAIVSNGLYLKGTATKLNANDPLLIDFGDGRGVQFLRVDSVEADNANDRTRVRVRVLSAFAKADGA